MSKIELIAPDTRRRETFEISEDGVPTLTLSYPESGLVGGSTTLEGDAALANVTHASGLPEISLSGKFNPWYAAALRHHYADKANGSYGYTLGESLASMANSTSQSPILQFIDTPISGGLSGAALGAGIGALGGWLGGKLGLSDAKDPALLYSLLGAAAGGALGSTYGYGAKKKKERAEERLLEKSSTLYQDPRNFILEKLQGATDVSMAEKAMLAGQVRNMSTFDAKRLAEDIRSAIGVGVGALIAKALGFSGAGVILGGLLGAIGAKATGIGDHFINSLPSAPNHARTILNNLNNSGLTSYNSLFF